MKSSKIVSFFNEIKESSGFDLTTRDSYFTILVEFFTDHILAENTYFTNHVERTNLCDYGFETSK